MSLLTIRMLLFRPSSGTGISGDTGVVAVDITKEGREDDGGLPANAKLVARNFRYMRRKPTIMAYKPPKGKTFQ